MIRRRIILAFAILLATVYVSTYGGTISYLLFFGTLSIPLISVLYLFFVYTNFKIYQKIETKSLVKGQEVPYCFQFCNESMLAFVNVAVTFIKDTQSLRDLSASQDYCLLPGDAIEKKTALSAKYRGEYNVGIDTVIIQDFFGLFKVTYKCPSMIQAKVLPRILQIKSLSFYKDNEEDKVDRMRASMQKQIPDNETRPYVAGDEQKMVHWKLTARTGELIVRKYTVKPQRKLNLILDISQVRGDRLYQLKCEDLFVEAAIAIANYVSKKQVVLEVLIEGKEYRRMEVLSLREFESFYRYMSGLEFERVSLEENKRSKVDVEGSVVLLTCNMTKELDRRCLAFYNQGKEITAIVIGDKEINCQLPVIQISTSSNVEEMLIGKGW